MPWRCAQCGETHEEAFRSCWRCGTRRPPSAALLAEDQRESEEETEELAEIEAQQRHDAAVADYLRDAGWYPDTPEDRWTAAGNGVHRLALAYRLYRERGAAGPHATRPDLDRLWVPFFLAMGVLGGIVLSTFTSLSWLALLVGNKVVFFVVYLGVMGGCVVTGRRVVDRELRAAAEAAVQPGRPGGHR